MRESITTELLLQNGERSDRCEELRLAHRCGHLTHDDPVDADGECVPEMLATRTVAPVSKSAHAAGHHGDLGWEDSSDPESTAPSVVQPLMGARRIRRWFGDRSLGREAVDDEQ